jgi:hypothetical protein
MPECLSLGRSQVEVRQAKPVGPQPAQSSQNLLDIKTQNPAINRAPDQFMLIGAGLFFPGLIVSM